VKTEFARGEGFLQRLCKLAAEHFRQGTHRKKEFALRFDPAGVIRRETAGWYHAMDMRMVFALLIPAMQDAEETDLSPQMFGVACDLKKCFGAAAKQQVVEYFLIL